MRGDLTEAHVENQLGFYRDNQGYHLSGFRPDSQVLEYTVRVMDERSNRTIDIRFCSKLYQKLHFQTSQT